jgi:hypothetical protein
MLLVRPGAGATRRLSDLQELLRLLRDGVGKQQRRHLPERQSKSIRATIVDECATCPTNGHIDLSLTAAVALGLGQGTATGDATSGVTWKAVDCPATGDIVGVYNNTYSGQIYFQNVVFPVAKATAGGHTGTQAFGYWDFGTSVAGQSVTLTDTLGHVVTGTIPSASGGSVGAQFPEACQ